MIFALAISLLSTKIFAAGDAGCGLGSLVFSGSGKLTQLFAVTTNGSFGSQTFGITSGTSNCSSKGLVQVEKQIEYFVEINQEDLTREMAQGRGEKLSTLAALNGCTSDAQVEAFNIKSQENFRSIVPSAKTSAVDFVKNMKSVSIADVSQKS